MPSILLLPLSLISALAAAATPPRHPGTGVRNAAHRAGAGRGAQYLDCYDYSNGGGDRLHATDYIPQLSSQGWDNRYHDTTSYYIFLLLSSGQDLLLLPHWDLAVVRGR